MPHTSALEHLDRFLQNQEALAIAFSGGLDSRFLAHMAQKSLPQAASLHLFHIHGPHIPMKETQEAKHWAEQRKIPITLVPIDPLRFPAISANGQDRCYHCKYTLFSTLRKVMAATPGFQNATLCDGTNHDDLSEYRPGLRALKELGITSPLADAKINKDSIRTLGGMTGLDNPAQHARPCLLTRFSYGLAPTQKSLIALDRAEEQITKVFTAHQISVPEFRLRLTGLSKKEEEAGGNNMFSAELHTSMHISSELCRELETAIAPSGFLFLGIKTMGTVGGHFDRQRMVQKE